MAARKTSPKSNIPDEDLKLMCPICLETFVDPRSLSCSHSFCLLCIQTHVTEQQKHGLFKQGIECPLCRHIHKRENQHLSVEKFCESLPKNQQLNSAIARSNNGNYEKIGGILCQPCQKMRNSKTATVYCPQCREFQCNSCIKVHNSFKALEGHKWIMLKPGTSEDIYTTIGKLTHCEVHGVPIKYLCTKESKFCCTECFLDGHRYCENVIKIDNIKVKTKHILDVSQQLRDVQSNLERDVKVFDDHAVQLNDVVEKIRRYVLRMKSRVSEAIDKQEIQILAEVRARQSSSVNAVSKQREESLSLLNVAQEIIDVNETLLECGTGKELTVLKFKAEEIIKTYSRISKNNKSSIDAPKLSIKESKELGDVIAGNCPLFQLQVDTSDLRSESQETVILDEEQINYAEKYSESEDNESNNWSDENQDTAAGFKDLKLSKHQKKKLKYRRLKKQAKINGKSGE